MVELCIWSIAGGFAGLALAAICIHLWDRVTGLRADESKDDEA
jgi:hypothetical protein